MSTGNVRHRVGHHIASLALVATTVAVLVGCSAGPRPLDWEEIDGITDANDAAGPGRFTVGEAVALAPAGTIGLIDARRAAGIANTEERFDGAPPESHDDWLIVGICAYSSSIPSVEVAAVPPEHVDAAFPNAEFHLVCDGTRETQPE